MVQRRTICRVGSALAYIKSLRIRDVGDKARTVEGHTPLVESEV